MMNIFFRKLRIAINPAYWFGRVYRFICRSKFKSCGSGFRAGYPFVVQGGESISVGNDFASVGNGYLYADQAEIMIGNNCSLNSNVLIGATKANIVIGSDVMIGPNVVIRSSNHGMSRDTPMYFQPYTFGKIIIEDDIWIGSNAVITAGVTLAKGTVVGAGAVVTKSTEPYSIVGGVPARKIGERV